MEDTCMSSPAPPVANAGHIHSHDYQQQALPPHNQIAWAQSDPSNSIANPHHPAAIASTGISHPNMTSQAILSNQHGNMAGNTTGNGQHHAANNLGNRQHNSTAQHAGRLNNSTSPSPISGSSTSMGSFSSAYRRHTDQDGLLHASHKQATLPLASAAGASTAAGSGKQARGHNKTSAGGSISGQDKAQAQVNAVLTNIQGMPQLMQPAVVVPAIQINAGIPTSQAQLDALATQALANQVAANAALSAAANTQLQAIAAQQQQQQQRRALTKPSDGVKNDGYDNENSDLVLRVGDSLIHHNPPHGVTRKYAIQSMLGQGTFGQVVSCWCDEMQKTVAVKVIKNQPAYFHQARVEIGLLNLLNTRCDPNDERHIVRMIDSFLFRKHLCIVFEKLDVNLFELLKRNAFKGLSLPTVQSLLRQLLDALTVLRDNAIMHCDLKPENILLKSMGSDEIKLIDFGSACFENRVVYSYIQSRFYRSPEVVLGTSYNVAIDMWSLGCVAAELFLGLPLFPGASEHDLMVRMVETLGLPPPWLLAEAKHTERYFRRVILPPAGTSLSGLPVSSPSLLASSLSGGGLGPYDLASSVPRHQHQHLAQVAMQQMQQSVGSVEGRGMLVGGAAQPTQTWVLLSQQEFETRNNCKAPAGKRYFMHTQLADIIAAYPMRAGLQDDEIQAERVAREAFIDFLLGVLDLDPRTRWTPRQAAAHPFITGAPFTGPFQPLPDVRPPGGPQSSTNHHSSARTNMDLSSPIATHNGILATPSSNTSRGLNPQMAASISLVSGAQPVPQPTMQLGSFQTSFIMGTPHKRAAVARGSPTVMQPSPAGFPITMQPSLASSGSLMRGAARGWHGTSNQQTPTQVQQGWGKPEQGGRAQQALFTTTQQGLPTNQFGLESAGSGGLPANLVPSQQDATIATAGLLNQNDPAHAAAIAAAARTYALAALQQVPPQLLGALINQGFANPNVASSVQATQQQPLQPPQQIPFPTVSDYQGAALQGLLHASKQHTSQQQQQAANASLNSMLTSQGTLSNLGQAVLSGPAASTQALAHIILGSTPSTSLIHPGTSNNMNALQNLQQNLPPGFISTETLTGDGQQNLPAMAAMRQAFTQLQPQQAQAVLQQATAAGLGNLGNLTPTQLMFLQQQQQQQQQALAAAYTAGFLPVAGGGQNAQGWGQLQQSGFQTGGWGTDASAAGINQVVNQMAQQGKQIENTNRAGGYQGMHQQGGTQMLSRPSSSAMAEDPRSPTPSVSLGNAGGNEPGSNTASARHGAGAGGGASPSDWDPLYSDLDLVDAPASPAVMGSGANLTSPAGVRNRSSGGGGRRISSRASSGQDGVVVGRTGWHGGVTSGGGKQHQNQAVAMQQQQLQDNMMSGISVTGQQQATDAQQQNQALWSFLQQQQQQQQHQQQFGGMYGMQNQAGLLVPTQAQPVIPDEQLMFGSLPFSGIGAGPAMQMYQVMLGQQQAAQAQQQGDGIGAQNQMGTN